MTNYTKLKSLFTLFILCSAFSQAQVRPCILFREDFKETPAEIPMSQEHIANEAVLLSRYGPGAALIKKSHHDTPADDPFYVWSGLCEDNWAVTLKHQDFNMDLSGQAKVRWRAKQSGFRELHLIIKVNDGPWFVSNLSDPASADWRIKEFNIADISWHPLDIETITEGSTVVNPSLENVSEIGWTDLMKGGISEACSRLDWIEVSAYPAKK